MKGEQRVEFSAKILATPLPKTNGGHKIGFYGCTLLWGSTKSSKLMIFCLGIVYKVTLGEQELKHFSRSLEFDLESVVTYQNHYIDMEDST